MIAINGQIVEGVTDHICGSKYDSIYSMSTQDWTSSCSADNYKGVWAHHNFSITTKFPLYSTCIVPIVT